MASSPFYPKRNGDGIATSPFYLKGQGNGHGMATSPFSKGEWWWDGEGLQYLYLLYLLYLKGFIYCNIYGPRRLKEQEQEQEPQQQL